MRSDLVSIQNDKIVLKVAKAGGAIVEFRVAGEEINPINFSYPFILPNGNTHFFKGHFICLGRWGDPSEGEQNSGIIKHGDFVSLDWDASQNDNKIHMSATSKLEGLSINRIIETDQVSSCFRTTEIVKNLNPIGRIYNLVQHPTVAAPFLDSDTIVDCNAEIGFDYLHENYCESNMDTWPELHTREGRNINLRNPQTEYSSVFSFVIKEEKGWLTAWSPSTGTLLGYSWNKTDFPWINHWIHWENGRIKYRGLEFGTSGVHKTYKEILDNYVKLAGERTFRYIDAGETQQTSYISFITKMKSPFKGVEDIKHNEAGFILIEKDTGREIPIAHSFYQ